MIDYSSMAAFVRCLNPESVALEDQLRRETEAAGSRYEQGQCGNAEFKACLERFSRLILDGELPHRDQ
jgi:hypothetical protein